ncbi:zinc-binding alcohol dehydrogenase [Solibacillus sp. CAU 1738]|uniref:zinc-dependent alcohol dehydrogenase n=1 Tax=Solibacillus sp. CAU 1738 TaxID=3140363 RepID=UPI0032609B3F
MMKTIMAINGNVEVVKQQIPELAPAYVLVKTKYTAISPGTEMLLLGNSIDNSLRLGYSAVGEVVEVGEQVDNVEVGDIVACYGAPYVGHSSFLHVPKTLVAKVPAHIPMQNAAFAAHGTIAIHAIRKANLQFGESVAIVGLGVLGQMIAKICSAAAYEVIAYDKMAERAAMIDGHNGIKAFSTIEDFERAIADTTNGFGVDAVLLCAGGKRSETTRRSLSWIRKQGKVVIVGDVEPDFDREDMFSKEAEITISRAGGPGRYDPIYEQQAVDYPYGYIRWTEGRNLQEFIRLLANKRIDVAPFISSIESVDDAPLVYKNLMKNPQELTKLFIFE